MIKKIIFFSAIISQLLISCTKSDEPVSVSVENLSQQIAAIVQKPYSNLTPAEQKVKLEVEANTMLEQMNKSKTSGAIEAIQNLGNLLSICSVDILNGKNNNEIEEILNVSDVFGIYTWNSYKQIWIKTLSSTELKFVFPAKKSITTNNASLTCKSTSSNIKVKLEDTSYGYWNYNQQTDTYTQSPSINDWFYLPTSADANLTIDAELAATFATTATYTGTIETPNTSSFKMVLSDGYIWEISGKKATENIIQSSFTLDGKNLLSFTAGSTADIDGLIKDESLTQYRGKANGLIQIMDNFMIFAETDIAGLASDEAALEKTLIYPDYNSNTYYAELNAYYLKESNGYVAADNKNIKLILVSKKDGTKIADVIEHSEKGYYYYANGTLVQHYESALYLKFNDNTEVALDTYFSTGFDDFQTKFENFYKSFENR